MRRSNEYQEEHNARKRERQFDRDVIETEKRQKAEYEQDHPLRSRFRKGTRYIVLKQPQQTFEKSTKTLQKQSSRYSGRARAMMQKAFNRGESQPYNNPVNKNQLRPIVSGTSFSEELRNEINNSRLSFSEQIKNEFNNPNHQNINDRIANEFSSIDKKNRRYI